MEGYCSASQSPQRAVAPMEEEEEDSVINLGYLVLFSVISSGCK